VSAAELLAVFGSVTPPGTATLTLFVIDPASVAAGTVPVSV
jgi:hypothetical protein